MSWSKVNKPLSKPVGWWYHKLLCEFGYLIEQKFKSTWGMKTYYHHLKKLCLYGFNLYGQPLNLTRNV